LDDEVEGGELLYGSWLDGIDVQRQVSGTLIYLGQSYGDFATTASNVHNSASKIPPRVGFFKCIVVQIYCVNILARGASSEIDDLHFDQPAIALAKRIAFLVFFA